MIVQTTRLVLGLGFIVAACGGGNSSSDITADATGSGSGSGNGSGSNIGEAAVSLSTSGNLGAHLVDNVGKTLYFFANDIAGSDASAYSGAIWPPFDVESPTVGTGLTASDFSRFDRGSGVFQTTWKGRPLYYYANDTMAAPTSGEGIGGRWFVARAYDLFFGANAAVTPQGGSADAPFLTNDGGLTLYVFAKDTPGTANGSPTSACSMAPCSTEWPSFPAPATLSDMTLPSTIGMANVTSFTNGGSQLVYKGWPLYFYASDTAPGDVAGASIGNWYAVDVGWNGTITQ